MTKRTLNPETAQRRLPLIRNRMRRTQLMLKLRYELRQQRKDQRKARHLAGEPLQTPNTIERMRLPDDSIVAQDNLEVIMEERFDEFSAHFSSQTTPKLVFTTAPKPSPKLLAFVDELSTVIPGASVLPRGKQTVAILAQQSIAEGYTDLFVFSEKNRKPDALLMVHLPDGPTAHFRITSVMRRKAIRGHGNPTAYPPELILNNFTTRLGQRLARMWSAVFPVVPEFRARNVATFHNQRDFVFARFHRYIFDEEGERVKLQELGPRFTLKLLSLQDGLFDSETGQFEFMYHPKLQVNRKRFFN